jgi:hypothetical protein
MSELYFRYITPLHGLMPNQLSTATALDYFKVLIVSEMNHEDGRINHTQYIFVGQKHKNCYHV